MNCNILYHLTIIDFGDIPSPDGCRHSEYISRTLIDFLNYHSFEAGSYVENQNGKLVLNVIPKPYLTINKNTYFD